MSDLNNMLEGTKILSLTDANGRAHEFISETEQEKAGFKLKYYIAVVVLRRYTYRVSLGTEGDDSSNT